MSAGRARAWACPAGEKRGGEEGPAGRSVGARKCICSMHRQGRLGTGLARACWPCCPGCKLQLDQANKQAGLNRLNVVKGRRD